MTKRTGGKVGYEFAAVPLDIAPEWGALPFQTRMLGIALWLHGHGAPIPVPMGSWESHLCRELKVNGQDRPNITRALRRLSELGLLRVLDGSATCLLRVLRPSSEGLLPATVENHSTPKSQIDKSREIKERETRTREVVEPLPPPEALPDPPLAARIMRAHHREYQKRTAGARPTDDNRSAVLLAQWCELNAEAYKLPAPELGKLVVAGLFASARAGESRWKLSWAAKDPAEFCGLPKGSMALVPKPLERREGAREPENFPSEAEYRKREAEAVPAPADTLELLKNFRMKVVAAAS